MKKLTTILISCSLALAASAMAQQAEESPAKKQPEKAHPARQASPAKEARQPQQTRAGSQAQTAPGQHQRTNDASAGAERAPKTSTSPSPTTAPEKPAPGANAKGRQHAQSKNERNPANASATANKPTTATPAGMSAASPKPATAPSAAAAAGATAPAKEGSKANAQAKKPDPQAVQAIKAQHANFRAQPKPEQAPPVTFNQSYRIQGADQWQGPQYGVFRSYRPEMHDRGWYDSRYGRVEIIGGGAYYWNQGYWYPAWGYDPSAQYYAYDGPIYVGSRAEPPDRVIADVQAVLQQEGYYHGEVDGLLGPLTRQALTAYQTDNGLYTTAAIDEPTLHSLGMG